MQTLEKKGILLIFALQAPKVNPSSEMHSDQTDRSLVSPPWRRGATCAEGGGA